MATTHDRAVGRAMAKAPPEVELSASVRTVVVVEHGYGGLVTRVLAAALDALLIDLAALFVVAVVALVLSIFPVGHDTKTVLAVLGGVGFALWVIAYFVTCWSTTGQTPGDRVMQLRVLREDGRTLGPMRALLRLVVAAIGLVLLLGYIPILLNDRRRAVHDWVAGTVVINQPKSTRGTAP
jgi:uncharacterized RDD family membrane protein YckC